MSTSRIAVRYSKSLIDMASAGNKLDAIKGDMENVSAICGDSKELKNLLRNPIIKAEDKKAVLAKVFKSTDQTTQDFIGYLVDKRRESELKAVADQFISSYNVMKGIASAVIVSATPLSASALGDMKSYVGTLLANEDIELSNEVDPSIIGGIIIKYEDKLMDKSVSKELREIRKQLIYN